ncbi:hypothetical protein [Dyadobacter sp. CY323]|uniref:hypothetical protein n=1 Tax=Dyadobacter sp. CY323 TaxID=2907302 RepID=UPI001F3401DF|nr:hypothetical protein [Dyadobacter sp. CY323]MCE6988982.1 hypothetical protein [Dyadobacter sp. CY323]
MSREHAEHNEKACDHLLTGPNEEGVSFHDWVVTTAFYSAMHYVQHEIFPLQVGDNVYRSFNEYYLKNFKGSEKPSKHTAIAELVKIHIYNAYSAYKALIDSCHTARYTDYQTSEAVAVAARRRLSQVKNFLKK